MHIHPPGLQSIGQAQVAPVSAIAVSNAINATSMVGAVSTIDSSPSVVATVSGGSPFQNLISQLMRQQGLSVADVDDDGTSDHNFQNFMQALTQSLAAGQPASSAASGAAAGRITPSVAGRFGQGGLEHNIRSLIDAMGGSQSTTQGSQLSDAFKTLIGGLTASGNATASSQSGGLSLQQVLQGMLQNVQQQGAPAGVGQFVDTFA